MHSFQLVCFRLSPMTRDEHLQVVSIRHRERNSVFAFCASSRWIACHIRTEERIITCKHYITIYIKENQANLFDTDSLNKLEKRKDKIKLHVIWSKKIVQHMQPSPHKHTMNKCMFKGFWFFLFSPFLLSAEITKKKSNREFGGMGDGGLKSLSDLAALWLPQYFVKSN